MQTNTCLLRSELIMEAWRIYFFATHAKITKEGKQYITQAPPLSLSLSLSFTQFFFFFLNSVVWYLEIE